MHIVAAVLIAANVLLGAYNCHFGMTKDKYSTRSISLKLLGIVQLALAALLVFVYSPWF
jgi:hypothetical protein